MLKYKINKSGFMSDLDPLDVYSYEPYLDAVVNEDRVEMVYSVQCKCSTPHGMVAGDTVAVTVTRETAETAGETDRTHGFEETATVTSVSPDGLGFTFNQPVRYYMNCTNAIIADERKDAVYSVYHSDEITVDPVEDSYNEVYESDYSVEETHRYIQFTFDADHYFDPTYDTPILYIRKGDGSFWYTKQEEDGSMTGVSELVIEGEYVARNMIRVRVPTSSGVNEQDLDFVKEFFYKEKGEVVDGVQMYDLLSVYYYENQEIEIDGDEIAQSTTNEAEIYVDGDETNPPQEVLYFTNPFVKVREQEQLDILGMDLMYYDGMVLVEDGNGSQIYDEEESAEEEETDDGLPTGWREVDLDGVDASTPIKKYIKQDNNGIYYVRDLTYHYVGTKDDKPVYKLLSDYDAYESQWKMYGVNINEVDGSPQAAAENNPYWILNETLFGMNVDAYAEVDTEWYVFSRDTFIFDVPTADTTAGITFSAVRSYVNVRIPLQQNFAADTYHEDSLNNFVANECEKAINPTREMEKNVYKPAVIEENDGGTTYKPVKRIEFNLHFRKRDLLNGEWSIIRKNEDGAQELWNGVNVGVTTESTTNGTVTTVTYTTYDDFFSYDEKQRQSDLLMFLGFTNNDVRYQRNKLKKTFLRLSIYDSEDEATQNLLAYYTVFYDNNKAFRKFAQYFDTTDFDDKKAYYIIDSDDYTKIDKHDEKYGIRVSREMWNTGDEEERLSSQFVVEDRNNTNSSSEGFYFYLWKDNYNPPVYGDCDGNDLFMRVEFNHAGYGRVVPFMMPFGDNMNILPFGDVLDTWNTTYTTTTTTVTDGTTQETTTTKTTRVTGGINNDINAYRKYSYIRLRVYYDKDSKEFYYAPVYSNPDYDEDTDTLRFNLYEGAIYEGEQDSEEKTVTEDSGQ